jgi:hypothetical protein
MHNKLFVKYKSQNFYYIKSKNMQKKNTSKIKIIKKVQVFFTF